MTKVLVVEDELHIQRLLQMVLEKNGFEVQIAANGEDGLKAVMDGNALPDVILLDIMMPGIDGIQVLKSLKGNSTTKDIPVLMLTALAEQNIVVEGAKLGVKDYIRKPFHPKDLVSRINKVLG